MSFASKECFFNIKIRIMKIKFVFIVLLSLLLSDLSANEIKTASKIKEITIFRQNARISRTASVIVPVGNSVVVFENLETVIENQSIQVKMSKEAKLLTANFRINYLKDNRSSADHKRISDSLVLIINQQTWINSQQEVVQGEIKLISDNTKLGSTNQGVVVAELRALADYYNKRMSELKKQLFELSKQETEIKNIRKRLEEQLRSINLNKTTASGEVVIEITSKVATTVNLELNYIVTNVNWTPLYDIRSEGNDKDVVIVYKANITQNTGVDWKNVKMTLSTGNPNQNQNRPILNPKYLYVYVPVAYERNYGAAQKEAVPETDNIYYKKALIDNDDVQEAYADYSVQENMLNIEFVVDQTYNIQTGGASHIVTMTENTIPAQYEYHAVPSLDKAAYLLAKITDWSKLNLLEGTANIFFENTYIGQTYINPFITADTMALSFGRDDRVFLKREKNIQESSTTNTLGVKKHIIVYDITVRNTKNKAIELDILDQIPLSNNKDIVVELLEKDGAEYVENLGKLTWKLKINPNETKTLKFKYSIKHPKNLNVQGF